MKTQSLRAQSRRFWVIACSSAIVLGASACSDALGLDGLSVDTSTGPTTSTGSGGSGGGSAACMDCATASCIDVLTTCYFDASANGCQAFLTCADACADDTCAAACLTENPGGQLAVDCFCSECSADCTTYCEGAGGSGGASAGGGGAGAVGGAGGGGGSPGSGG